MTDFSLNKDWALQSSAVVKEDGSSLSTSQVDIGNWYKAELPATVLGTLVESGEYEDPFFGENILKIPGQGPKANNFSNHPMPDDSPFKVSWWYRKVFTISEETGTNVNLQFDGINYRANIWLNGNKIADTTQVAGAYREFELDVTSQISRDGENVLAVEVFPPEQGDIAITWVDWNPSPPDKNMGLWRDVWLRSSDDIKIRAPHVATKLKSLGLAELTVACDLVNTGEQNLAASFLIEIDEKKMEANVDLAPKETKRFEQVLEIESPRLWWPRVMGDPALYQANLEIRLGGSVSDSTHFNFGIREVSCDLTDEGYSLFRINGEPILIRGAGWATDLFLRRQPERELAQLRYVKDMNLNTIRFEGMLERASFLEWCDREGILIIAGWSCCDSWEMWDDWTDEHLEIAKESLRSQVRRSRRHPSMISWWYGSDFSPPEHVESCYLDVLKEEHWPNASHSSAADKPTDLSGSSGLKMEGPYDYVPPNYWLEDTKRGGAFGFATEVCPGPAVPPIESIEKMIPEKNLWPIDSAWNFHAGGQEFHNIDLFKDALIRRYGDCSNASQFAEISQVMTYEAQRAMFEAYARNKFKSTGVIQWMLNNAWPSLIWHLYDYYLRPAGGYFGTKKACEPLHVMYAYDDRSVVVTNDYMQGFEGLRVDAKVLSLDSRNLVAESVTLDVAAGGVEKAIALPYLDGVSPVYLIDLKLFNREDALVSSNFYWVPAKLDVLDFEKGFWIHTPIETYADLRSLRELPDAPLGVLSKLVEGGGDSKIEVELKNPGEKLAFFTQLRVVDGQGEDTLPINWSDNYVSLLPGETCVLSATIPGSLLGEDAKLHVKGVNVPKKVIALSNGEVLAKGETMGVSKED